MRWTDAANASSKTPAGTAGGRVGDPLYGIRRVLRTAVGRLTDRQHARLTIDGPQVPSVSLTTARHAHHGPAPRRSRCIDYGFYCRLEPNGHEPCNAIGHSHWGHEASTSSFKRSCRSGWSLNSLGTAAPAMYLAERSCSTVRRFAGIMSALVKSASSSWVW